MSGDLGISVGVAVVIMSLPKEESWGKKKERERKAGVGLRYIEYGSTSRERKCATLTGS